MAKEPQLRNWKRFCDERRTNPEFCDEDVTRRLNRFRARYRAALNFKSVVIDKASDNLTRGYSAGIRLLLSYSAAEVLGAAIESSLTNWTFFDSRLVREVRDVCAKYTHDRTAITSPELIRRLSSFVNGEHDNLRVAATGLRVLVAHGHFAPVNAVYSRRNANAVVDLSTLLLNQSESRFGEWFEQRLASRA
jgi:hypothetical protein